ncbi:MAG: hypothetical protein WA633_14780 [Stellaceae bacterium]
MPDEFGGVVAEEPFGRIIDRADGAIPVDDDNCIDPGINDRAIQGVGQNPTVLALEALCCRTQVPTF